jgi:hypothetical protein
VSSSREESRLTGRIPLALRHLSRVQRSFLARPDIFGVLNELRTETQRNQIDSEDEESNISISIDIGANGTQDPRNVSSTSDNSDGTRPSPETVAIMGMVQRYLPFVLIVIAKGLFDHGIGKI